MRLSCQIAFALVLVITAAGQSVQINKNASKVVLRGMTYDVQLVATSTQAFSPVTLQLEIIGPSGNRLASSSSSIYLKAGANKLSASVVLPQLPKRTNDLIWYRLAYRIYGEGSDLADGVLPLFESVEEFALHVSAPALVQPGKKFFVRVHTNHPVLKRPVGGVAVTAFVRRSGEKATLASGSGITDARGYVLVPILLGASVQERDLELAVKAKRGAITKNAENEIKVGAPTRILVQSDKPLYQPSQVLHIRALLFGDEHRAVSGKKMYVQVEDEDGTIVFRDQRTSSRFGAITVDWTIPERVRLGEYRIIAKTYPGRYVDEDEESDDENPITAGSDRKTVRISRYDLPTFVVNAKPDRAYYLPEQKASVEVSTTYLFGKPVSKGKVRISRLEERRWNFAKQQWEVDEEQGVEGVADEQGTFRATLDLAQDQAELDSYTYRKFRDVTFTSYVTDPSTGRTEQRRFDVRVTKYPIHVYYVAPGPSRRGLPDEFFISTSYADGAAAECDVEVRTVAADGSGERVLATAHTNRYGVARIRNTKATFVQDGKELPLILVARDHKGVMGLAKESIWPGDTHFLRVITNRTIFAPEEPIEAEVRSDSDGEAILELVNEWKVLRSFTVRLKHHSAFVKIPYSNEFTGQLALVATDMGRGDYRDGFYAAHSVIYPQNRDLKVSLRLDRGEYRPGQEAAVHVQVSSGAGSAVPSLIGAVIFDKAVEERARIDQDLRDPFGFGGYGGWWYRDNAKLASLSRADLDRVDTTQPIPADLDIAADFLLNASGSGFGPYSPGFGDEYGTESLADVYKSELDKTLQPLLTGLDEERKSSGTLPRNRQQLDALLHRQRLNWADLKDPWGSEFIPKFELGRTDYDIEVSSPGPDKRPDTDDDFRVAVRSVGFYLATERQVTRALQLYHEKQGGFVRDLQALQQALAETGSELSKLNDPWRRPYIFSFGTNGSQYTITAKTLGESGKPGEEYMVGTSAIDYFAEPRAKIDHLLPGKIQALGRTPDSAEEFKSLLLPEFRLDDLRDPFGRPYLVRMAAVARYSDRWVQSNQQVKTEPVTIWTRLIKIRSAGPDGIPDTADDFDVAVFSAVLSEVTVTGKTSPPAIRTLFTGNTGGISGVVTDPTGAVVPNAKVFAVNANTNIEYETTTDDQGSYLVRDLPPGVYDLSVQMAGFVKATARGLVVRAQEAIAVNLTLRIGATTETVEVQAVAPTLNTTSSSIAATVNRAAATELAQQATVTPRLRQYFPETLLWQPSIETDSRGRARINWKFADNLTTWKLSIVASTLDGRLATAEKEIRSFQPFFVEHDPPKVLTLGDRILLPVLLRNYTNKTENVRIEMPAAAWFHLTSKTVQEASLSPGEDARLVFPFEAIRTTTDGKQRVIATGKTLADAIERPVVVHPYGAELTSTEGRIISDKARLQFEIAADAIPGSVHAELKIYPNLIAHVVESLEGMLARPWGCGEQTISSTYPSVLLLQFEKQSKQSLGPLHDRALHYVSLGYTRLLTYADESGGFTYWGHGEPDLALTAYAVRFLHETSDFAPVDPDVLNRARQWLFQRQKADGGWVARRWYTSSPVEDALLTAYIARILAATRSSSPENKNAGREEAAIQRALDKVALATTNYSDPYLFATYGLAELDAGRAERTEEVLVKLRTAAEMERGGSFWELHANTPFYGWGHAGRVETTALAVQLLSRAAHSEDSGLVDRGLEFLVEQKDRYGAWYSTQTTVNVINALLLLTQRGRPGTQVPLTILVNGTPQPAPSSHDLGPEVIDISSLARPGANTVDISGGRGTIATAQTVANYYVPWTSPHAVPTSGPLKLNVTCDRMQLEIGGKATCNILAERIGSSGHGMLIAEIGIPPGVDVDRDELQRQMSQSGWDLSSFEVLPDRVVAYVWPKAGGSKFAVSFTARMGINALSAPYTLFDYYNPDASITIAPTRFIISEPQ